MALDISKLTLGEISKIEECSGERFTSAFDGEPSAKTMAAVGMIAKRREQMANGERPTFDWNAAQDLTYEDVSNLLGLKDEEETADPKEVSEPSKTSSRTKKA